MKEKGRMLLFGAMAMSMSISNPYEGLSDVNIPYSSSSYVKSRLTKKQKKARVKSKQAKIARRRNR